MKNELTRQARARLGRRNPKAYLWALRCTEETSPYPLQAKIEPTVRCQLRCPMCYRTNMGSIGVVDGWACHTLPNLVDRDMTLEDFKHVLGELKGVKSVSAHGWGEPLMHPQFMELMREIRNHGMDNHLVTNGLLLNERLSKTFIQECEPIKITFSVDAGEKEAYEQIRIGAKFDLLLNNIRAAIANRNQFNPSTQVDLYCTLGTHNLNQIESLAKLGASLGVDVVSFNDLTLYNLGIADSEHAIRTNRLLDVVSSRVKQLNRSYAPKTKIMFSWQQERGCELAWTQILVQVNGDVSTCGCDPARGNILRTPLKELWNNAEWRKFRRQMLNGEMPQTFGCYTCTLYNRCGIEW